MRKIFDIYDYNYCVTIIIVINYCYNNNYNNYIDLSINIYSYYYEHFKLYTRIVISNIINYNSNNYKCDNMKLYSQIRKILFDIRCHSSCDVGTWDFILVCATFLQINLTFFLNKDTYIFLLPLYSLMSVISIEKKFIICLFLCNIFRNTQCGRYITK